MSDVEYITTAENAEADKLADCTSELIENWTRNNGDCEPYVILTALTKLLTRMLRGAPNEEVRLHAAVFIIHMLLGETEVDHHKVMRTVALLTAGAADGGFNA
jgi:hypothetical protein